MRGQAKVLGGSQRLYHLIHRPSLSRLGVAADGGGGKAVESLIIGGVDCHKLALQVGRKLGHFNAIRGGDALEIIAIGFRRRRFVQIEQAGVPAGHLHALIAAIGRPGGDAVP